MVRNIWLAIGAIAVVIAALGFYLAMPEATSATAGRCVCLSIRRRSSP